MACYRNKNLSHVLAKSRVHVFDRKCGEIAVQTRHFFYLYLWDDRNALNECCQEKQFPGAGLVCHQPYYLKTSGKGWRRALLRASFGLIDIQKWREVYFPMLGEIHFLRDAWNMELVAHECLHAALGAVRALEIKHLDAHGWQDINGEERFCYLHGMLFADVCRWLWEVNPHGGIYHRTVGRLSRKTMRAAIHKLLRGLHHDYSTTIAAGRSDIRRVQRHGR